MQADGKARIRHGRGDDAALSRLTTLLYRELQRIARRYMRSERAGHTLQTTALVNEVYLRLVDVRDIDWRSRAQFFALAAKVVELRYFGGMSEEEAAEALDTSPRTVQRDWQFAKAWLMRAVSGKHAAC